MSHINHHQYYLFFSLAKSRRYHHPNGANQVRCSSRSTIRKYNWSHVNDASDEEDNDTKYANRKKKKKVAQ